MRGTWTGLALYAAGIFAGQTAVAQVRLDRADPTISEQVLPSPAAPARTLPPITAPAPVHAPVHLPAQALSRIAAAIVVDGNEGVPARSFAPALVPFIGRDLSGDDLSQLAAAVAGVARAAGYPFATATVTPQDMAGGILHVTLDEGRITAVRVLGASTPLADGILARALVNGRPVRRDVLERAIMLVGDIPGMTIKDSRFVVQNGFGILLVTARQDTAAAYAQIDNRGSAEVGPIRATLLASYRGLGLPGDELALIGAATPIQPSEFSFLRARYSAPVDLNGSIVSISGSYGHANPGASLKPLDVVGNSVDVTVGYSHPLLRRRARSLWGGVEFRALQSDQTLLGTRLRDDRLATLTGSLNGMTAAGPGALRGEASIVVGLPLSGVTHQGDRRTSRSDGDARFVTLGYTVDWTVPIAGRVSAVLASSGQLASRPLLATAEIGAGGPAFGRAYDYAERTGDRGVLGSAELRAAMGRVSTIIDRCQLYTFVDGGYVDNLRGGTGGGSLLSGGAGLRLGRGLLDGMIEVALPFNKDRFDTGSKRPRFSFRLSRSF